ncbi:hypothetical protein Back2_28630 [Nocardioides baekrokdamisoli]|uniref:Uncharacterized protein n=2 Tax=Nocardioides baekrokdamisoli TaxID=1804624 RepID=A0A3G9IJV9_9ACTN|nr:hypothetical protein Back2_28630 [Nocardioides baekrokdamisoli]
MIAAGLTFVGFLFVSAFNDSGGSEVAIVGGAVGFFGVAWLAAACLGFLIAVCVGGARRALRTMPRRTLVPALLIGSLGIVFVALGSGLEARGDADDAAKAKTADTKYAQSIGFDARRCHAVPASLVARLMAARTSGVTDNGGEPVIGTHAALYDLPGSYASVGLRQYVALAIDTRGTWGTNGAYFDFVAGADGSPMYEVSDATPDGAPSSFKLSKATDPKVRAALRQIELSVAVNQAAYCLGRQP